MMVLIYFFILLLNCFTTIYSQELSSNSTEVALYRKDKDGEKNVVIRAKRQCGFGGCGMGPGMGMMMPPIGMFGGCCPPPIPVCCPPPIPAPIPVPVPVPVPIPTMTGGCCSCCVPVCTPMCIRTCGMGMGMGMGMSYGGCGGFGGFRRAKRSTMLQLGHIKGPEIDKK
uniref:Uncharacterized protein n=1 Tax=Strongyloides venezuelensis TaxID=75913 RepID=A0A0K0EW99_STRVS